MDREEARPCLPRSANGLDYFLIVDNKPYWLEVTQGLMVATIITLVLATVLLIYWICSNSRNLCVKIFIILLVLCSRTYQELFIH